MSSRLERQFFTVFNFSDFVNGVWTEKSLNISDDNALNILRSSVSSILAFTGFTGKLYRRSLISVLYHRQH